MVAIQSYLNAEHGSSQFYDMQYNIHELQLYFLMENQNVCIF